jgi:hypothetical protein
LGSDPNKVDVFDAGLAFEFVKVQLIFVVRVTIRLKDKFYLGFSSLATGSDRFNLTIAGASVSIGSVSVIAFFPGLKITIAALSRRNTK